MNKEEKEREEKLRSLRIKIRDIDARKLDISEDLRKNEHQQKRFELEERGLKKEIDRLELDLEEIGEKGEKLSKEEFLLLDELKGLKKEMIKRQVAFKNLRTSDF